LIASEKCDELFAELKKRYDYIVIDTPPIGMVTDSLLLMRYSDANIFIVRQGVTNKNAFGTLIKDLEDRGMQFSIVLNGLQAEKGYGYGGKKYGYSYGYGYGYGYGYSSDYYGDSESDDKKKRRHSSSKKNKEDK
jgi:Mrp family chromosome partitioning ATPase